MLFEERWLFVLANLDHEMSRRMAQIESEKAKTLCCTHLNPKEQQAIIREKTVILSEMVFLLECLFLNCFLSCLSVPMLYSQQLLFIYHHFRFFVFLKLYTKGHACENRRLRMSVIFVILITTKYLQPMKTSK